MFLLDMSVSIKCASIRSEVEILPPLYPKNPPKGYQESQTTLHTREKGPSKIKSVREWLVVLKLSLT